MISLLTLGIFWVGQRTQLNHLARSDRSLSRIHLVFLFAVSITRFPGSGSVTATESPALFSFFNVSPTCGARLCLVRGRVHGVGFRDHTQRLAAALGLIGYVRNLDDDRVEVYAAGPPGKLSELAGGQRKGPCLADVRGVEEQEAALHHYSDFQSRFDAEPEMLIRNVN